MILVRKEKTFVELPAGEFAAKASSNIVIVSPSGQFSNAQTWENELYGELAERLEESGVTLLVSAIERVREDSTTPATAVERTARENVLIETINLVTRHASAPNICLLGVSLGSHVVLDVVAQNVFSDLPITALILVSLVLEEPVSVLTPRVRGHLVYGENDGVVYMDQDGSVSSVLSPNEYSQTTRDNLLLDSQQISIAIINGAGHLLERPDGNETAINHLYAQVMASFSEKQQDKFYECLRTTI